MNGIFRQERWRWWTRRAAPEVLVILDQAIEEHARNPEYPGYWWVRRSLGEESWPPFFEPVAAGGGHHWLPACGWEGLVVARGDLLRAVPGLQFPDMVHLEPAIFSLHTLDNAPATVTLTRPFAIGTTPVTVALYRQIMGQLPDRIRHTDPNQPVTQLNYNDALRFCNMASYLFGFPPVYRMSSGVGDIGCSGFRLPTEAEWEFAARGGENFKFAGSDDPDEVAWSYDNTGSELPEVALKKPNDYGLYDMSGLVQEWCWDRFGLLTADPKTDPTGPERGNNRVARGGSWRHASQYTQVITRVAMGTYVQSMILGLRLCRGCG